MSANTWEEKRRSVRFSYGWPKALITFQGAIIRGRARDISSHGALVHIQQKLEIGDRLEVTVKIPDIDDVLSASGTVVTVTTVDEKNDPPTYAIGIHFTKMACWSSESVPL